MKVQLKNKKANTTAYGLVFDENGSCECDKKVVESLLDTGALVEFKAETVKIKVTKK